MIVYRITNKKNGKSYIGFTSKSVDQRWSEHVYWALHRNSHYRIHAAIRKYGPENFEQYVLAEGSDENYVLNTLEPKFIAEYNTQKNGYNTLPGGSERQSLRHSDETKQKMSLHNRWRGKSRSGQNNPMYGKHHTDGAKLVMSMKRRGKATHTKKFIVAFPDGTKQHIDNLAAFCREHGLDKNSMSSVANGRYHTHKGFICCHTKKRVPKYSRVKHVEFQYFTVQ